MPDELRKLGDGVDVRVNDHRDHDFVPPKPKVKRQGDYCVHCDKKVYFVEKLEIDGLLFHKACFKCATCNTKLTPRTYAKANGNVYCKSHYDQHFKLKGNYTGGFDTAL